jgi:hypothetical protein
MPDLGMTPFFSVVTVTRNDCWSLTKTMRSIFRQSCKDHEYLVVDGASTDGNVSLVDFWRAHGLVTRSVSEADSGVYNAMNKALGMASGRFVLFMNAGDVFADDGVLARVRLLLQDGGLDGALGWGELGGQLWASWIGDEAFKLSSLGFCHQSLYVRRELLLQHPFDERKGRTDSDTLQLSRVLASGARIEIVPEVWAVRGTEPGISANTRATAASIVRTLVEEYEGLDEETAQGIIGFRRGCESAELVLRLLRQERGALRRHLACMVLDTLFLRQSAALAPAMVQSLYDAARSALGDESGPRSSARAVDRLFQTQQIRSEWLAARAAANDALKTEVETFARQEAGRIGKLRSARAEQRTGDFVVSLTSFPARLSTLHFVIQSLVEQDCRPREIHLWLGSDEVPARHWLPRALLEYEAHGLQIHFTPRTCHQYDKFLHNAALNAERPFVIVDDDVIYPPESMAHLLAVHERHPGVIVANRCHRMAITDGGGLSPYSEWKREVQTDRPSLLAFPTGAGGVLYPPGFLTDQRVTDVEQLLAHAPYADDIWLKACALARDVPTMASPLSQGSRWYLRYTPTMRAGALHATNVDLGLNDMQLARVQGWLDGVHPGWREALAAEHEHV